MSQPASKTQKYWQLIKASLKGDEFDYTSIGLKSAVFLLAIPMMLELALESVFAVVDIYFVNKLGVHSVSVVGLTESVITIVYSVGIGLSAAATAVVSRRVGEKDLNGASKAGAQAILIALGSSMLIGIPGALYADRLLGWMGAEPTAIVEGAQYAKIMLAGNLVIILLFLINGIFRGAGNAAIAMKSLWIANLFNIALDPILIFGIGSIEGFGVTGAAIATTTGRSIGVIYQLVQLKKANGSLELKKEHFVPDIKQMKNLLSISLPATAQFIIASASWIFLAAMVAEYGSTVSAGYQTAIRLITFFIMPAWGMSNAAATLVGQNLGASAPQRAEDSVRITTIFNVIFMAFVTVLFWAIPNQIVQLLIPETANEELLYAADALKIISAGYIFYGIGMVVTQAFNGAGDTKTPTWVYIFGFWIFQVPFAYYMHKFSGMGANGIFIAVPIAETLMAIVMFLLFKQGKWKTIKV